MGLPDREFSYEYRRYIKSEEWAEKRKQRLELDEYKCTMCGAHSHGSLFLEVHHTDYSRFKHENIFEDLASLCPNCHRLIHAYDKRIKHDYRVQEQKKARIF